MTGFINGVNLLIGGLKDAVSVLDDAISNADKITSNNIESTANLANAEFIKNNSYEFPLNKELQPYGGKVIFTIMAPKLAVNSAELLDEISEGINIVKAQDPNFQKAQKESAKSQEGKPSPLDTSKGTNQQTNRERMRGATCSLYMPESINISDAVQIGNIDLGSIGGALTRAIAGGGSAVDNVTKLGVNTINDLSKMFTANGYKDNVAKAASIRAMGAFSTDAAKYASAATGVTVNPNTMAIFEGVNLRAFNFDFVLMPTSHEEAIAIKNIIKFFRTELYPERINAGNDGISLGYNFPNLFEIKFKYKDKDVATKIDLCYLKSFSATYNNGNQSFHNDGEFTSTQISMQFVETEALHRIKVEEDGY